jgi:hypothetical protein
MRAAERQTQGQTDPLSYTAFPPLNLLSQSRSRALSLELGRYPFLPSGLATTLAEQLINRYGLATGK